MQFLSLRSRYMRGTLRAVTGETFQGVKIRICHQMDTMCKETVIKGNNENPYLCQQCH